MRAKRSTKRSDGARLPCACSTSSTMRASVESAAACVVRTVERAELVERAGEHRVAGRLVDRHATRP